MVLLLDRPLDLRQVRLRLAGVEALALRDLDVVDQGGELDLHLLASDLALRAFQGFVQAELDLPHAFVLALVERFLRLPKEELRLVRVRADALHLRHRVAGRREDVGHAVLQLSLDLLGLTPRLLDELPGELDVRLQRGLRLRHELVRFDRLGRAEGLDHLRRERDRAIRERPDVRGRVLRDQHELLDHVVDPVELVEQARPLLEDGPVPVLHLLQDLEHVQREQLRFLAEDDRGQERVRRPFYQDFRIAEVEALHPDPGAALERILDEVLDDREHPGEDVLVDLLPELAAVVGDEPSVGVDQEDVLDEVRGLRLDLDLPGVLDLVPVLVEEPLVRDPDADGDRPRRLRPHADPDRHDFADADLRDRHHALRLQVPGQLDLDVPGGQLPAVLDLERVLVPLADLQPRALDAQGQIRVAVLDEILDLHPDGDLGLFDQDVRHRHVAPAERGLRLVQGILRVPEFRAELLRVRNHRGDGVDAGLVLLDETFRAGFLDRGPGVGQAPMEAVDVPTLDGLPGRVQMGTRGHRGNVELLRLRHDLLEGPNLVHGTVHDLLPLRLQETFLEIPLESVHFLDVVRGSRFLRVRAVLVQFLRRKAQREPVLDQRGEGVHDGGEVLAACRVDLVGDALRVSVDVRIFARVHERLGPREEFRGHADVGPEFRVRLQFRPELREIVPDASGVLLAPGVLEDVFDDLLVLDRLDEATVLDRFARILEDRIGPARVHPHGPILLHDPLDGRDQIVRGGLESCREGRGHLLGLPERGCDLAETARIEGGVRPREGLIRAEDRDVGPGQVPDRLPDRADPHAGGVLRPPTGFGRLFREDLEGVDDFLLRGSGMLDRVRVLPSLEVRLRGVQQGHRFVGLDALLPAFLDLALRPTDQILRGRDEFVHQLLRGRIERREDRVDVVEVPFLQGPFRGSEPFLRPRDVDVCLPQVFDQLLDRDELRRGGPRHLERPPLLFLLPRPATFRDEPVDLPDRLEHCRGATRLEIRLRLGDRGPEFVDLDPFPVGDLDRFSRPLEGVRRLAVQRDLHTFHNALRRGDEMVRLIQGAAFDRLFGRRQGGRRPSQVEVLGDQVRDVRPHDFHAAMDPFHPFELDPRLLGDGLSL